ncbi:DUF695 domain-containing protein [Peribacillus sp. FSL E2-0218]|uniref:DUF695 domain-containing protein n=1 Tax=Peribacillus sp. FSL E2-0218 TaxID=2921364 RepID=UPI0030ED0615
MDREVYQHAIAVRVEIKNPNEEGFPLGGEADLLYEMEEDFDQFVDSEHAVKVGRVTSDGLRDTRRNKRINGGC